MTAHEGAILAACVLPGAVIGVLGTRSLAKYVRRYRKDYPDLQLVPRRQPTSSRVGKMVDSICRVYEQRLHNERRQAGAYSIWHVVLGVRIARRRREWPSFGYYAIAWFVSVIAAGSVLLSVGILR
jgi:hypothetical protein